MLDDVRSRLDRLERLLATEHERVLAALPLEAVKAELRSLPPAMSYAQLGDDITERLDSVVEEAGASVLAAYLRALLLSSMRDWLQSVDDKSLPDEVRALSISWLEDVVGELDSNSDDYYNHHNDPYLKDLAVCLDRLIPVGGAWSVEPGSTGREFLSAGGPLQFVRAVALLIRSGGPRVFYLIHTVDRYVDRFNEDERDACYLRIAQLLRERPDVKGYIQVSWYYDPALEGISPHLAVYRRRIVENGGSSFRVGSSPADVRNATLKSKTRRALYEKGEYVPTSFLTVWPRARMLAWAARHEGRVGS